MGLARSIGQNVCWAWVLALGAMSIASCGDDDGPAAATDAGTDAPATCASAEDVRAALAAAGAGDIVELAACAYEGPFDVPAGVTLRGAGDDVTTIVSGADEPAIRLLAGAGTTRVESLGARAAGHAGVLAEGEGDVVIQGVAVTVDRGIGIAVGGRASLALTDVSVFGTMDAVGDLDPAVGRADAPTYGIIVLDVGATTLTRTSVSAFARGGAVFVRAPVEWTAGDVSGNRAIGVGVWESSASFDELRITGTVRGRVLDTFAILAADGAALSTRACTIDGNESIGVLHDASSGEHDGITVTGSFGPAIWTQRSSMLRVTGAMLTGNRIAGVLARDASGVVVEDTMIAGTELGIPAGTFGDREPTGDGVHVVREDGEALDVVLDGVTFIDNARVGVLLDGGDGAFGRTSLADVSVDGDGEALGAIAQRVMDLPMNWDDSVERLGVTAANDDRFEDLLSAVGIVMPPELPEGLEAGTLATLLGP